MKRVVVNGNLAKLSTLSAHRKSIHTFASIWTTRGQSATYQGAVLTRLLLVCKYYLRSLERFPDDVPASFRPTHVSLTFAPHYGYFIKFYRGTPFAMVRFNEMFRVARVTGGLHFVSLSEFVLICRRVYIWSLDHQIRITFNRIRN